MPRSVMGRVLDGLSYSGITLEIPQTGSVFYVSNSTSLPKYGITGSDNNDGKTPEKPKATLAGALAQCSANRGDTIILMQGHAQTLTASNSVSIAGVKIIGLGTDTDRPTFTLTTASAAGLNLAAANIFLSNILIIDNVGVTAAVTAAAVGVQVDMVEVRDGTSSSTTGFAVVSGTSNGANDVRLTNCLHKSAGATNGALLSEVDDNVLIENCRFLGSFSAAGIVMSAALTNLTIRNCDVHNTNTSGYGIHDSNTNVTGMVTRTNVYVAHTSDTIVTAAMSHLGCWGATTLNAASALV